MLYLFRERETRKKIILGSIIAMIFLMGISVYAWYLYDRENVLEIYVIPLKVGQATFIRTPSDKRILIDGGQNGEIIRYVSKYIPFYSRRIDTLIVSKNIDDRVGGLIEILDRYKVGEILIPKLDALELGISTTSQNTFDLFLSIARGKGIEIGNISSGDILDLDNSDSNTGVIFKILFPVPINEFEYSKASDPGLVFSIEYKGYKVFSLNTTSKKIQKYLSSKYGDTISSNILILANSPNQTNLDNKLLEMVNPDYFIFSKKRSGSVSRGEFFLIDLLPQKKLLNIREIGVVKIMIGNILEVFYK